MPEVNINLTIDKTTVGLGNVDNTSDANKPVSTAQQAALDLKLDAADYVQHFLGVYASLGALETAHPTATSGDYAQVDPGTGTNLQTYSWDTDEGWVLSSADGSGASNTDQLPEGSTNLYYTTTRVNTWWDGIKSAVQTISGLWSFTGGIKSKTVTIEASATNASGDLLLEAKDHNGTTIFKLFDGGYLVFGNAPTTGTTNGALNINNLYNAGETNTTQVNYGGTGFTKISKDTADFLLNYYGYNGHSFRVNVSGTETEVFKIVNGLITASTSVRLDNLTASQILELDASKNIISTAKGTAYNKDFGTTAGTVAQGNDYRFGSQAAISGTDIDWNTATHFYKTLSANTTFTFSNLADAKTIQVAITNTASNYTVTWPTVDWGSAGAPTQRTGAVTDIYTFTRINGTVYGAVRQ